VQIHPVRAGYWCLLAATVVGLTQAPSVCGQAPGQPQLQTPVQPQQQTPVQPQQQTAVQPRQTPLETQQQTNDRIRALSARTFTAPHDYIIGRGDVIGLEVFEIPELSRDVRVSQTGTIGIPLVPVRLYVAGLTELQVQQKVAEVLEANGLVSHPQVMVSVRERRSKPITIVGAVGHSMVYQADHPVTLVQVLAEAGGISADAGDTVNITRAQVLEEVSSDEPPEIGPEDTVSATNPTSPTTPPARKAAPAAAAAGSSSEAPAPGIQAPEAAAKQTAPQNAESAAAPPPITNSDLAPLANTITVNLAELLERGDTRNNIPLQAGDIITVPHAGIVYALGAVQRAGGFVVSNDRAQLSTLKLLALSGGVTRVAKKGQAVIIRKDSTGKQMAIPVDLGKIIKRESEDVRLMPSDILYVPDSPTKAALIRAGEITLGVGTNLAVYRLGTGF
jgi:protein involved in polysaccharide export with SLBB domain